MAPSTEVYVALGGNIGDTQTVLKRALQKIDSIPNVKQVECSRFYFTAPVSPLPQASYVNAVCRFHTTLSAKELLHELQKIETALGKIPKPKDSPRCIDLDILFFGKEVYCDRELEIPHPRWRERLFVLVPLADLTKMIEVPNKNDATDVCQINVVRLIDTFSKNERKQIILL